MLTYKKNYDILNANVDLLYCIQEVCQIPVTFRSSAKQQDSFIYLFIDKLEKFSFSLPVS